MAAGRIDVRAMILLGVPHPRAATIITQAENSHVECW